MGSQRRSSSKRVQSYYRGGSAAFKSSLDKGDIDNASKIISSTTIASTEKDEINALLLSALHAYEQFTERGIEEIKKEAEKKAIKETPEQYLSSKSLEWAEKSDDISISPDNRRVILSSLEESLKKIREEGGEDSDN